MDRNQATRTQVKEHKHLCRIHGGSWSCSAEENSDYAILAQYGVQSERICSKTRVKPCPNCE